MKTIHVVAGARPNFMKAAPLLKALAASSDMRPFFVHTGQHFSPEMASNFFRDLGMGHPDFSLGASGSSHATQTASVMIAYEALLRSEKPDAVVVIGDVNSTVAAALGAAKLGYPVVHLEAGLRSFDRTMPEEINRVVTDSISDLLWTPSPDADANLLREGRSPGSIARIGNIMIDSLEMMMDAIERIDAPKTLGLSGADYALVTLHRPANVDVDVQLAAIAATLLALSERLTVVFPVHPRTRSALEKAGVSIEVGNRVRLLDPLSYLDFISLMKSARLVVTDSGGVQEETTHLGIPCLTLRPNTERPITVTHGTNRLVTSGGLLTAVDEVLALRKAALPKIDMWDGHAANRAVTSLRGFLR